MQQAEQVINYPNKFQFFIINPFHPKHADYQIINKSSQIVHQQMMEKKWSVWGSKYGDNQKAQWSHHLFIKDPEQNQITKQKILKKLKKIFDDNNYQNIGIYLFFHTSTSKISKDTMLFNMQVGKSQIFIQIRQILNLWKPLRQLRFKHLLLILFGCGYKQLQGLMKQYQLSSSSISIISSYNKNNSLKIAINGDCFILNKIYQINNPQALKYFQETGQKLVTGGSCSYWLQRLAKKYLQQQKKGKIQLDKNYEQNYQGKIIYRQNSRYFGRILQANNKWYKNQIGFMQSPRLYFEGNFKLGKFGFGKLHYKQNNSSLRKFCLYGNKFDGYNYVGLGCYTYQNQQENKQHWGFQHRGQSQTNQQAISKYDIYSTVNDDFEQSNFWQLQFTKWTGDEDRSIKLYFDYETPGKIRKFQIEQQENIFLQKKQFEEYQKIFKNHENKQIHKLKVYYTKTNFPNRPQIYLKLTQSKNGKLHKNDYKQLFQRHNLFDLFNHYVKQNEKIYYFSLLYQHLKVTESKGQQLNFINMQVYDKYIKDLIDQQRRVNV